MPDTALDLSQMAKRAEEEKKRKKAEVRKLLIPRFRASASGEPLTINTVFLPVMFGR